MRRRCQQVRERISATNPIAVGLSPIGLELSSIQHSGSATWVIDRFMAVDGGWSPESNTISTSTSRGAMHVFPVTGVRVN